MPITFEYNKEEDILYEKIFDFVTIDEVIESFESRKRIPGYYPSVKKLCDCTKIKFDISNEELKKLVDYVISHSEYFGSTRWAIVTADPLAMAFARIYAIMTQDSPIKTKVFSSAEEALKWLKS
ncbi:MAG: hypothetical protein SFU25_11045 [Candidatus Caenarcaniphilales bacterium]|nr:hypothetical protein [Candidatus Caenarcaniphilales bacterium]